MHTLPLTNNTLMVEDCCLASTTTDHIQVSGVKIHTRKQEQINLPFEDTDKLNRPAHEIWRKKTQWNIPFCSSLI